MTVETEKAVITRVSIPNGSTGILRYAIFGLRASVVATVGGWILNLPGRLEIPLFTEQMLAAVLGFSLALTFLSFPLGMRQSGEEAIATKALSRGRESQPAPAAIDIILAAAALAACLYVAVRYQTLIKELIYRPWDGVLVSGVIILLVFEACRRVAGLWLILIVLALCAHAMLGWVLPEPFTTRQIAVGRLLAYLAVDTNALLGGPLHIAVVVVTPFVVMGHVLARCGGSDFFAGLASALMGGFRGGAAKIAVVGSAFFGMMSGSAVANVASVWTVTIPLMKRAGFPAHLAAGIEAVGSTGGQIAPPVMGAAAFIMAEYLQVPYAEVMLAAIIPALLFYASLFIQVDLESAKLGIKGMPREDRPSAVAVLHRGWHFLLPFAVLVASLLWWNLEAEYAALLATAVLSVLALLVPYNGQRITIRQLIGAVVGAGGAVVDIVAVTAISGILIGAMTITGVTISLTQQLLALSGGSLGLLLIVTAFAAFILGLPLPTVGVYVILAALAAPALVHAGILPMQAHMFVFFNGLLGMVTPPVALSAFAAATIAKSDQWKTGWVATRISWCAYFIPFLFAYSPELLMHGDLSAIAARFAFSLVGIFMGTVAVVGYLRTTVTWPNRCAYALIAVLLLIQPTMFPGAIYANIAGLIMAVASVIRELARERANDHPA